MKTAAHILLWKMRVSSLFFHFFTYCVSVNIYIYQVNYEAHTFDPPLRFEKVFDSPYYEESRSRKSVSRKSIVKE